MLTQLAITDFAVVHHAELSLGPGMTVISGETGAGKSLLVDALGFLCGQRADAGMVRHGAERAELSAEFDLADAAAARAWLYEQEMDEGDSCQLRRVLRADGGSKAWINGRAASASQLAELGRLLVDIHGQHAQQVLLSRTAQLQRLDAYGNHAPLLQQVAEATAHWQALQKEWTALTQRGDVAERLAFLRHQWQELEAESLDAASLAELDAEHRRLAHGNELTQAHAQALALLGDSDEGNARAFVHRARDIIQHAARHDRQLAEVDGMLESAAIALDEASASLARLADELELDPERLEALEQRLQRLHALARKHRVAPEALAGVRQQLADELDALENAENRLDRLQADIDAAHRHWLERAGALSAARREAAAALSAATVALVRELGMGHADFTIALDEEPDATPSALGRERAEFLIAANPGQPPRPLRKVASGGELSRISLAIEVAAFGSASLPTLVFDEVDTGISGGVAEVVGRKLRALGERTQVLCVTHLPQVAAQGHAQWQVRKAHAHDRTQSEVTLLDEAGRIEAIAGLLGGLAVDEAARQAARSLLQGSKDSD